MTRKEIDKKIDDIIEFSGVKDFIETPIKRYSTGMNARLGFAVAAQMSSDILLVDEVLSVGDAPFRAKCIRRMSELMHSNVAVIFVSHNMEQIRQLCSKTLVLSNGHIEFVGPTDKAIDTYMEVLQKGGSSQDGDEPLRQEIGKILGLHVVDKTRKNVNQIHCGEPNLRALMRGRTSWGSPWPFGNIWGMTTGDTSLGLGGCGPHYRPYRHAR